MKVALTIAGFDPTCGAGIQADLKVFRRFNVYGISILAAITAQNTEGLKYVIPVNKEDFNKQFNILISDIKPDAVKIGMVYSKGVIEELSVLIEKYNLKNIIIDPLINSSSGGWLIEKYAIETFKERLLPLADIITPNVNEASVLTGISIKDKGSMEEAARILKESGAGIVIITGGDFGEKAVDLFYNGKATYISKRRIKGNYHGTGCAFSSAMAALIAQGGNAFESMKIAKNFVYKAIQNAYFLGKGMGLLKI